MPTTTVRAWSNITPPASADPTLQLGAPGGPYLFPNAVGDAVPAGKISWALRIDQSNVPAGQSYGFHIEFSRARWTDKAGVVHPAGEWLNGSGSDDMQGGPIALRSGGSTFINEVGGPFVYADTPEMPYPSNVRVRITRMQAWLFPTITLVMS